WRVRLLTGVRRRAPLPGRAAADPRRGLERDPAARDRAPAPRAARALTRPPAEILTDAGVSFRVHEHMPVATVAEILQALPFPAEEHVKTLAFDADGRVALAALRGSDRPQFGRLARAPGVAR